MEGNWIEKICSKLFTSYLYLFFKEYQHLTFWWSLLSLYNYWLDFIKSEKFFPNVTLVKLNSFICDSFIFDSFARLILYNLCKQIVKNSSKKGIFNMNRTVIWNFSLFIAQILLPVLNSLSALRYWLRGLIIY